MKKKILMILMISLSIATTFFGAAEKQPDAAKQQKETYTGRVISTMDSGGYTYVEFEIENGEKFWAAGPSTPVSEGDLVAISDAVTMSNFHSNTLNRTFESILFTISIRVVTGEDGENAPAREPAPAQTPHGHPAVGPKPGKKINVTPGSVKKLEGGYTVAECFAMKKELKGKELAVRGIVVKFSPRILGKNWLHIKDGTGEKGSGDLTVTTTESVRVGDLIIVKGIMACDKNFGAGYFYPVILEDASIIVE